MPSQLASQLQNLVPFLEATAASQDYLVHRLRELARGGAMSGYRWVSEWVSNLIPHLSVWVAWRGVYFRLLQVYIHGTKFCLIINSNNLRHWRVFTVNASSEWSPVFKFLPLAVSLPKSGVVSLFFYESLPLPQCILRNLLTAEAANLETETWSDEYVKFD